MIDGLTTAKTRTRPSRQALVSAIVTLLFVVAAQAATWYDDYAKGEEALKSQSWTEAIEALNRAIEQKSDPEASGRTFGMNFIAYFPYFKLGIAYYNLGQYDAAVQAFDTEEQFGAIRKSPNDLKNLQTFRGLIAQAKRQSEMSQEDRIASIAKKSLEDAAILERQGRLDDALTALSEALSVDPENADALAMADRLRQELSRQEAQRELEGRVAALVQEGRDRLAAMEYEAAASAFEQANGLQPSAELQQLIDESRAKLRARFQEEQDARALRKAVVDGLERAGSLESEDRLDEALHALQSVIAPDPENDQAKTMQSRIVQARGELQRRQQREQQIVTLLESANGNLDGGRFNEAVASLNRVISLDPGNETARVALQRAFRSLSRTILDRTTPILPKIPPSITLMNRADAPVASGTVQKSGAQDRQAALRDSQHVSVVVLFTEERVETPDFELAGLVLDDQPEIVLTYLDGPGPEGRIIAEERIAGEKFTENIYKFRFSRAFDLEPGVAMWRVLATDTDGLTDEIGHRVNYLRPWTRSPWTAAALFAVLVVLLSSHQIRAMQRRNQLFRRKFNPYIAGAPVLQDDMFFGRMRLMSRVLQTIHNNSLLLFGERRIGKTSFLHHLKARLEALQDPDYRFFPAYIDLQGTREEQFFQTLAQGIFDELSSILGDLRPRDVANGAAYDYHALVRDVRAVLTTLKSKTDKKIKLVLLIDEVDELNAYDPRVNQRLRSLFMKSFAEDLVAVVSGVSIKKHWASEGSPWYNFFEEIPVKPFQRKDAAELIERPIKGMFTLENGVVDRIVEMTDCKPYPIQKICVELVNRLHGEKRRRITLADVAAVSGAVEK